MLGSEVTFLKIESPSQGSIFVTKSPSQGPFLFRPALIKALIIYMCPIQGSVFFHLSYIA